MSDVTGTTDPRNYSVGDRTALTLLSRGSCYWPDCGRLVVMGVKGVEGRYSVDCQIAHIRGADKNGLRYDERMSNDERRKFPNLIYLCKGHHEIVDDKRREREFPSERLLKWKADREAPGQAALAGLRELTEDRLQELIAEAYELRQEQILAALERLKDNNDSETAGLMRQMFEEIEQFRQNNPYADIDAAIVLNQASNKLVGLADTASSLLTAANSLSGLVNEDLLNKLGSLVRRLEKIQDYRLE